MVFAFVYRLGFSLMWNPQGLVFRVWGLGFETGVRGAVAGRDSGRGR
jgi:hypothetical protein